MGLMFMGGALVTTEAWAAQDDQASDAIATRLRNMQAGEYVWLPELAPEGPVLLVVSLKAQRAIVYRNGIPIGVSTVSSGKEGHETPTGIFTILQKEEDHRSNLYNDAPMPFMQRLTWDGIALHAGNLPGYPASHGCIRLPMAFAQVLYDVTRLGMTVLIADDQIAPRVAPTPDFLAGEVSRNAQDQVAVQWDPASSPEGPVSIVVSAADRRIIVLRNAVQIGSAPVAITGEVSSLGVFTLGAIDQGRFHWLQLGLTPGGASRQVNPEERSRLQLPADFQASLREILEPGATAIVTPDSLTAAAAGEKLVVIDSEERP
ncbi:L,D-transpeptidase [Sphingobium sp.]|uniref:L,D-transpeptidase n=1 Tax=Sphingobium sp. TaxID=1912891 RepID=UPI00257A8C6A|nr:L,D-transpeptidase [Sphingobium sp.]